MSSAFSSCEAVEDIVLDEVVERIGPDAFEKKSSALLKAYALDALNRMDTKTDFRI